MEGLLKHELPQQYRKVCEKVSQRSTSNRKLEGTFPKLKCVDREVHKLHCSDVGGSFVKYFLTCVVLVCFIMQKQ